MNWDQYFLNICNSIASKSPCMSRQIGAIIVREKTIISTGYNGPARGMTHCHGTECPRKSMGFQSGKGLEHCPSAHAEVNAIGNAARIGVAVGGATMYMNCQVPCKECMNLIVNSGIVEIVVTDKMPYHRLSLDIAKFGNVSIRHFDI